MLNTKNFGQELKTLGFDFYTGVPCSFLKYLLNYAINECEYIIAPNEGDAVAIASGAYLGGKKPVVLIQNSGLTNAVSPLTSLNYTYQLPVLGFVSLRGEEGIGDEPQHELMGQITTQMLEMMQVEWEFLSKDINEAKEQLKRADKAISENKTFFFVVKKGTFEEEKLVKGVGETQSNQKMIDSGSADDFPTREKTMEIINSLKDENTVQFATTGKCGRELYEIEDAPNNLYMVGSMGCVSSLGLGLAVAREDKKVFILDGDGSVLMRMGNLPTIGHYSPSNLLHFLLDNATYDSTGGQDTLAGGVDFTSVAKASNYTTVYHVHTLDELRKAISEWQKSPELTLIYMKIKKGSKKDLGRPKIKPYEVKERIMKFLNS